ncbi:MAG: type IV pilus secretin PilQ [Thermodesulfobacteriota bacterium]
MRYPKIAATALVLLLAFLALDPLHAANSDVENKLAGGKKLFTIEVRDADIRDVLRALAQQGGLNIIIGKGVEGYVTLSFSDIGFKDAMEVTLRANGLGYAIRNNVLWVGKKEDIGRVGDELDEIETRVVRLNYADPKKVVAQVQSMLSGRGSISADTRVNSIIIRDIEDSIDDITTLLETLDVRTAQVIIEARIVEANTNFARELGVQWGGRYSSGRDTIGGSPLLPNSLTGRNYAVNLPAVAPTAGVGLIVGSISDNLILDIELSAAERKGQLRIISRPRISALNNETATIHSGLTIRVKTPQSVVLGQGTGTGTVRGNTSGYNTGEGVEEIETGIDLEVTPRISDDGYIQMEIHTEKDDPDFSRTVDGIPGISEKSATTKIIIKDGETAVIGGLYKSTSTEANDAVPLLGNIPVLGWLFKSNLKNTQNEELLVFITPRIVKYDTDKEVGN